MARFSGTLITEVEAQNATQIVLLEITTYDGMSTTATRLTTATQNIDALVDGQTRTFTGAGGFLSWAGKSESSETDPGIEVELSGVDQSIVSLLLNNFVKGQPAQIWVAWLNESTGAIVDVPYKVDRLYQNERWTVKENWSEGPEAGTATVSTTLVSRRRFENYTDIVPTVESHNAMLDRGGVTTGDRFWDRLPQLIGRKIFWGRDVPDDIDYGSRYGTNGPNGSGADKGDGRTKS